MPLEEGDLRDVFANSSVDVEQFDLHEYETYKEHCDHSDPNPCARKKLCNCMVGGRPDDTDKLFGPRDSKCRTTRPKPAQIEARKLNPRKLHGRERNVECWARAQDSRNY
ncbi:MAG: hypothetical protein NTY57_06205 [Solirubrobacterales bacterium]|nr:hypothetical protein [Solirubrobacterales bacterium]